ncbi:MAG: 50S ribosomal protein L21 [Firmicutes bacterium]|nr:50S ribosomal protein L21 [Bacillota bacterium]
MYAVVQTGGKQYRVSDGDVINVEKLNVEEGSLVTLDQVLVVGGENGTVIGKPFVPGASVAANVVANGKAQKVVTFKYKAKKDYSKKMGHRQPYTQLEITQILTGGDRPSKKAEAPKADVKEEAAKEAVNFKAMKKAELVAYAEANGIAVDAKATKDVILAAIEAAQNK